MKREWQRFDDAFFARMRDYLADECDWFGMDEDNTVESLADAFRAAHQPPKPEEPTGLGAVVEDAEGHKWVYVATDPKFAVNCWRRVGMREWRDYSDITAVRVLSPGVTS